MYKVRLQSFEGPFDLLVYLIETAEMSIYDIKISQITNQYLEYLQAMQERNIAVATEFMVLAASLIEIKSKMILPRVSQEETALTEEDPRTELVERLLEYKRFKQAAQLLEEREEIGMRMFEKPQEDISAYLENPDEYLSLDLKQFAAAFRLFIEKKHKVESVKRHYERVERERASMEKRMSLILKAVRRRIGQVFSFKELIQNKKDRYDIVVTFLSLLEMAKERVIRIDQQANYGDISVSAGERVNEDTVLEYDEDAAEVQSAGSAAGGLETGNARSPGADGAAEVGRTATARQDGAQPDIGMTGKAEVRDDE